ncbi:unnamed protein product [Trichobilharzia regenti]|nr:unnamed protein product [Trichobilharzia regenti]
MKGQLLAVTDVCVSSPVLVPNGEVNAQVRNGRWFGDAFIFTTQTNRLCYYVGGEVVTLALLDRPMYLLGYLAKENRLFLGDRDLQVGWW